MVGRLFAMRKGIHDDGGKAMKLFVLVIITVWSFGGGYQNTPRPVIVNSLWDAAVRIEQNEFDAYINVESDRHRYELFRIDLDEETIERMPIPKIEDVWPDSVYHRIFNGALMDSIRILKVKP